MRTGKKIFWTMAVAAAIVIAAFGAAFAAEVKIADKSVIGDSNGIVSPGASSNTASAAAYFLKGNTDKVKVIVEVSGDGFTAGDEVSFKASGSAWTINAPATPPTVETGGTFGATVLTLEAASAEGGIKFEEVTVTVEDKNGESAEFTVGITGIEIVPDVAPKALTFTAGEASEKTVTISDSAISPATILLDDMKLFSGSTEIASGGKIWTDDAAVTAVYATPSGQVKIDAASASTAHDAISLDISAASVLVSSGTAQAAAAGKFEGLTFKVEVVEAPVSEGSRVLLSEAERAFTVGEAIEAGADDISASVTPEGTGTVTGIATAPDGKAENLPIDFNGVAVSMDLASSKIMFSGTPTAVGAQDYYILGEAAETSGDVPAPAKLTVEINTPSLFKKPAIRDANGGVLSKMIVNEQAVLSFDVNAKADEAVDWSVVEVTVNTPPDPVSPDIVSKDLTPISEDSDDEGYFVGVSGDVKVNYTAKAAGGHTFAITYTRGGETKTEKFDVSAANRTHSSGSSGGCAAGFGAAGLLAIGGFALLRRRVK